MTDPTLATWLIIIAAIACILVAVALVGTAIATALVDNPDEFFD